MVSVGIDLEIPSGDYRNACFNDGRHKTYGDGINLNSSDNLEPHEGMDFESKEEAFSLYKEYAKSVGFTTIIKASRRSRTSGKFIDAKFVCTRYGSKKDATSAEARDIFPNTNNINVPLKRKRGRINRSWSKTDCQACLHVKRRQDGRWVIRSFVKEHNHEIFSDQANYSMGHGDLDLGNGSSRSRAKKKFISMAREPGHKKLEKQKGSITNQIGGNQCLALEEFDAEHMLSFFLNMQNENPYFFYSVNLNEEQRLRSVFWVDAKGRVDYESFSDVVSFDTTYIKNEYKLPFVPFIGVNHHGQFLLLGCGLLADETKFMFVWLMRVWLKAMGGRFPRVILTDQNKVLKEAVSEVFPSSRHCFALWNILGQIPEKLGHVLKLQGNFMAKFKKCIFKSCMNEEFEKRWWKLVDRFNLGNETWFQELYWDREYWVPMYMRDVFLAGMCTTQRSECVNSLLDKYVQRKTTSKGFLDQYKGIIQDRCKEEAKADFETLHRQPGLKSPSPFGKQTATVYTHAIFKKFQVEVVGGVACHPRKESEDGVIKTFRVQDFEQNHDFVVLWNVETSDISCSCRLFEFSGFLCRHAMIVLQMSGVHSIPSQYILKRWTKDAKSRQTIREQVDVVSSRAQRYKDLCLCAFKLSDEASLSTESYNFVVNALEEALRKFENMAQSTQSIAEPASPALQCPHQLEDVIRDGNISETSKDGRVTTTGQEHTNSRAPILDDFFGTQQFAQGMEQLNTIAPIRDTHYITQQRMNGIGQLNIRPQTLPSCFEIQDGDGSNTARPQLHGMASKLMQSKHPSH